MGKKKIIIFTVVFAISAGWGIYQFHAGKSKRIIYQHRNEHHPVIYELFDGRIEQGQSVDDLLSNWQPSEFSEHDVFMTLYYVKQNEETEPCCWSYSYCVEIIVMNHKLVKALAIEGVMSGIEYVFFDGMDEETDENYWNSRMHYASGKK